MPPNSTSEVGDLRTCKEDIVISGISGQFPSSSNIDEFEHNLYNKVNMVDDKETRFQHSSQLIPRFSGKIKHIDLFDADLFGVSRAEANNMDPQLRILLEESYKAIIDAGINPKTLYGTKTGVYVGSSISETEELIYSNTKDFMHGVSGCRRAMFANRISYVLGLTGPSLVCDTACSSSMYALDVALAALQNGEIDAAIVGGANLCLHFNVTLQFALLGVLSSTGICRPFDADANGYCRSEVIGCLFLQKRGSAKRIYASVIASKTNCDGFKLEGITYPSSTMQQKLLTQIYDENKIDFNDMGYIETHGTATIVGDPEECKAIDNAIARHRSKPLLIGSVKSNCGHSEPAAGICSIAKVLLAMNTGIIPPNINFKTKKDTIEGLRSGRLSVVISPTDLIKPIVGINSFGFGGANAHVILKQFEKIKNMEHFYSNPANQQPRLVLWSARTEESVNIFLTDLEKRPFDFEYWALTQNIQETGICGMKSRGYSILLPKDENNAPTLIEKKICTPINNNRNLVWLFSGIGAHWNHNAQSLMQLSLFKNSIEKSHNLMKHLGLNIHRIISTFKATPSQTTDQIFVGTTALQIALIDVLKTLGVKPDFIVGQSIGELACAYADDCLTAEETLLASYYCGKISMDKTQCTGIVAMVRSKFEDIKNICTENISLAGIYPNDHCLISGPTKEIANVINSLKKANVYVEELIEVNIGFHGKTINNVASDLLTYLSKVITQPKKRSNNWISTSLPVSQWIQNDKRLANANYFVNNLQSPILFEQVLPYIPSDALVLDFGPSVFQRPTWKNEKTLKNSIKIMHEEGKEYIWSFMSALGSLYMNGIELSINQLYPEVQFPVSRGTRCISPLIELNHTNKYKTYNCDRNLEASGSKVFHVTRERYQYLLGHEIDGRILLPATFYLECVWRTLSGINNKVSFETLAVEFENVKFERATTFPLDGVIELTVVIHFGSGRFEITESDGLVVSGFITPIKNGQPELSTLQPAKNSLIVCKQDFYKELKLRGYHYKNEFQGVQCASSDGAYGEINWIQNWVTFIDCMLQINIIKNDCRKLLLPTRIRRLRIYPQFHISTHQNGSLVKFVEDNMKNRIVAGGVEIIGADGSFVQRRKWLAEPVLESYQFISHYPAPKMPLSDISRCCVQLVLENQPRNTLQIVEVVRNQNFEPNFLMLLSEAVSDLPLITGKCLRCYDEVKPIHSEGVDLSGVSEIFSDEDQSNIIPNILVLNCAVKEFYSQTELLQNLEINDFLIIRDISSPGIDEIGSLKGFELVALFPTDTESFVLLRKGEFETKEINVLDISNSTMNFSWIGRLQKLCKQNSDVVLIAQKDSQNGIIGLTNCLRVEPETKNISCVFIDDENCQPFDPSQPLFAEQLKKKLAINVYRYGTWGSYRHLKIKVNIPVAPQKEHIYCNMGQIGDFSSMKWMKGNLTDDKKEIKVVYSSLNFKDVMQASGRLPVSIVGKDRIKQNCLFGFEYSGIELKTGKRVMGMTNMGSMCTYLENQTPLHWEVPKNWTMQEASTVPVVYLTVYYALFYTADIRKGKTILIHAGSGAVGLAAIRIAQEYGLEVFTTVSTKDKKDFLLNYFPKLKENHIGNSGDNSFENMILEHTDGKGVDFVLNSLAEDKLKTSIRCLGIKGHFLEIGRYDMDTDNPMELAPFLNGLTFSAISADKLLSEARPYFKELLQHISVDIEKGIIVPLPATVFDIGETEQAFRYFMTRKHKGKVIIKIWKDEDAIETTPLSVEPQIYFNAKEAYVIPGGLGGFGLELVDWMILRGARKIVLSSSRGITNDYQSLRISLWKSYGCEIEINTADIGSMEGCLQLLTSAMKLGPIGGIFNLAVQLRDAVFQNQSVEQFLETFKPKAFSTIYLDQLSRQLCKSLRYFVVFSSVSCGRGNAGQSNYGMANSIMERIIEDRVANNLPGKAIQWGAVGEVGLVAEMAAGKIDIEIGGTLQQRIGSCLHVLDVLLSIPNAIVSSMVVAEKKKNISGQSPVEFVLNILAIRDIKSISMNAKLSELGLDSLTSVEIRQTFERDYGIFLNTADLRSLTVAKLVEISEDAGTPDGLVTESLDEPNFIEHLRQFYGQINEILEVQSTLVQINSIKDGSPIFILPGIDGCGGKIWDDIGKQLHAPAYVLQYQKINGAKTIEEIVDFCVQVIIDFLDSHKTKVFKIIGYSLGALIAHHVTSALENKRLQGKVIFIDGSPQFIQNLISTLEEVYVGFELEKMALSTMLSLVLPILDFEIIQRDIRHKLFKEELFRYIHDQLTAHNYAKTNEMMSKVEAIYQRLKIIQNPNTYTNLGIIDAEILLLKPTDIAIINFDENYGLSPFTRNQIKSEVLEGNHQSILKNNTLPPIINKFFKE